MIWNCHRGSKKGNRGTERKDRKRHRDKNKVEEKERVREKEREHVKRETLKEIDRHTKMYPKKCKYIQDMTSWNVSNHQ